jgi:DHA3 family macrolide efflux protein-like MFS transporter
MHDQLPPGQPAQKWMPPFFTIWSGQAISLLGSQLVQFALVWWLTQKTGSATVLATATLVAMLPQVFLGPLVGALVDRWNRRIVMMAADAFVALATLVLAILFWQGKAELWHVYLMIFARSIGGGFHWPAMSASTSLMVPKEHLSRVQGMNQILNGLLGIGSAPLGALLMSLLPMQGILAIDIVTAAFGILPLFFIPIPQPARSPAPEGAPQARPSLLQDLKAGFKYVWAWTGLVMIVFMAMAINFLLTPTGSLQPILVTKHFGGQAMQLAWMESAWGIGMLVGGVTLSVWGGFKKRVLTSLAGLVLLGATMTAIGFLPSSGFGWAIGLIFVTGFTNPIVNGPLLAVVQAVVAPDMQGRVFTLISSLASAMTPLSLLIAGPVADQIGVQSWFVIGGVVTAAIGIGAFLVPAIVNIESQRKADQPAGTLPPMPAVESIRVTGD